VAANSHFKAQWAQWEAAPPEWVNEEWRANLPQEYYRAFYGREQPKRIRGWRSASAVGSAVVQPAEEEEASAETSDT